MGRDGADHLVWGRVEEGTRRVRVERAKGGLGLEAAPIIRVWVRVREGKRRVRVRSGTDHLVWVRV